MALSIKTTPNNPVISFTISGQFGQAEIEAISNHTRALIHHAEGQVYRIIDVSHVETPYAEMKALIQQANARYETTSTSSRIITHFIGQPMLPSLVDG